MPSFKNYIFSSTKCNIENPRQPSPSMRKLIIWKSIFSKIRHCFGPAERCVNKQSRLSKEQQIKQNRKDRFLVGLNLIPWKIPSNYYGVVEDISDEILAEKSIRNDANVRHNLQHRPRILDHLVWKEFWWLKDFK